jgi:hypothetical protein
LISSGFVSTERIGLVLLLWPGVELALLALKCELSRWGNGNRTMAEEAKMWAEFRSSSDGRKKRKQEYEAEDVGTNTIFGSLGSMGAPLGGCLAVVASRRRL